MRKRCLALILTVVTATSLCGCNSATMEGIESLLEAVEAVEAASATQEQESDVKDNDDTTEEKQEEINKQDNQKDYINESGIELVEALNSVGPYPTEADYSELYENIEAAKDDCNNMVEMSMKLQDEYKGKLDNKDTILNFFHDVIDMGVYTKMRKLSAYKTLINNKDLTDSDAQKFSNYYYQSSNKVQNALAFYDAEIYALPMETREEIFASSDFDFLRYYLNIYQDPERKEFSEDEMVIINTLTSNADAAQNTYYTLKEEMEYPTIIMPDGQEKEFNEDLSSEIILGDYSHDFMKEVNNLAGKRYEKNIESFAKLLQTAMQNKVNKASVNGFDNYLAYALHENDIEPVIFDKNIESARNVLPDFQRYNELRKEVLKIEDGVTYVELLKPVIPSNESVEFDDAVSMVEKALTVYGDDYIKSFDEMIRKAHIDVYPSKGKRSGGFEIGAAEAKILPYIQLNYRGSLDDVSTLAHEGGHAMYTYMAENAPGTNDFISSPGIFTQEIASTLNQYIFYRNLIDSTEDEEQKLIYLDEMIRMINNTIINQTKYSEFEKFCYEKVESGEGFTGEEISDYWASLEREYLGDACVISEGRKYAWAGIHHFYYGYYVYKYSTSATYSGIIANRIFNGDDEIIDKYLEMLALGGSMKPSDLLKTVDIDPTEDKVYSEFAQFYKGLLDEYEDLLVSTGRIEG